MKAIETSILEFFQQPMQMIVFDPQRNYRWTEKQCQQLWDDIIRVAQNESAPSHFIGTILYVEKGIFERAFVPKLILLDGQQRLVTISLLVAAIGKVNDKTKGQIDIRYRKINDLFLFNSRGKGEVHYKLILARTDKDTFTRLIKNKALPLSGSRRLIKNYQYFENKINECEIGINLLYKGLSKLTVMGISTDRMYENTRLVYESVNSTGLDKTQTGLIRNWLGLLRSAS
jgi:uncharacterized protein with ParB-like and HNH nuclease domain